MGFYVQDDFWEACSELPRKAQNEVFGALVRLFFEGDEKPDISGASKAVFVAFRDRVLLAKKKSEAGKATANQNDDQTGEQNAIKRESKRRSKRNHNGNQNAIKPGGALSKSEKESKREKTIEEPPLPPLGELDGESARFCAEALAAFNEEAGSDIRDLPGDAYAGLRRIRESGRTVDDVRMVVRSKIAEWRDDDHMRRFIRPSTLFGPKFEEYLATASQRFEEVDDDAEFGEYAGMF